jgi:hypothetical protein
MKYGISLVVICLFILLSICLPMSEASAQGGMCLCSKDGQYGLRCNLDCRGFERVFDLTHDADRHQTGSIIYRDVNGVTMPFLRSVDNARPLAWTELGFIDYQAEQRLARDIERRN